MCWRLRLAEKQTCPRIGGKLSLWSPSEISKIMWLIAEIWRTLKIILDVYLLQLPLLQYLSRPRTLPTKKRVNFFHNCNATAVAQRCNATTNGQNTATNTSHIPLLILLTYALGYPFTMVVLLGLFMVAWNHGHILKLIPPASYMA